MKLATTSRNILFLVAIEAIAIFAGGYILEYFFYYSPCVLCFIQRFLFLFCGVGALGAAITFKHKVARFSELAFSSLSALCGLGLSVYHYKLQLSPMDKIHSCKQDISDMLERFEFGKIIESWLHGDPECQIIQNFLGINLVCWSIGLFTLLLMQIIWSIKKAG